MSKKPKYTILHIISTGRVITDPSIIYSYMVEEREKTYTEIGVRLLRPWRKEDMLPWAKGYEAIIFGSRFSKSQEYRPNFYSHGLYMFGCDLEKLKTTWSKMFTPNDKFVAKNMEILSTFQNKMETGELDEILYREEV
jgi:hypothetical protein